MLGMAGEGPVSESESERFISSVFFAEVGGIAGPIGDLCGPDGVRAGAGALGP